jgi:hypothetical protein
MARRESTTIAPTITTSGIPMLSKASIASLMLLPLRRPLRRDYAQLPNSTCESGLRGAYLSPDVIPQVCDLTCAGHARLEELHGAAAARINSRTPSRSNIETSTSSAKSTHRSWDSKRARISGMQDRWTVQRW